MSHCQSSLSPARSFPHDADPTDGEDQQYIVNHRSFPPRYSNLALLSEVQSLEQLDGQPHRSSLASLGSRSLSPSYTTYDRYNESDALSITSSTPTLVNPPPSPGLQNVHISTRGSAGLSRAALPSSEHTFDILGGFKSERWATLRLYDAEASTSKMGRHPRFSDLDPMLGSVELHLVRPQTIKAITLTLKGSMITSAAGVGGSTTFLDEEFTIWDRKFGDPLLLTDGQLPSKYDGKIFGNWAFPFSIPLPVHVNLSTLHAIYPREDEGPVRFLPESLDRATHIAPLGVQGDWASTPARPSVTTPFDLPTPSLTVKEKRMGFLPHLDALAEESPHVSSASPPHTASSSTFAHALEPYTASRLQDIRDHTSLSGYAANSSHSQLSSPRRDLSFHDRRRGRTSMQNFEPSVAATQRLPQSFVEREVAASIRYELTLCITHGRFSTKSRVSTPVVFAPTTVARPMTLGRQIAYRHREIPPCPSTDPGSWKRLPSASIRGTFGSQKDIVVHYDLFLSSPLSYTRGTAIPCYLAVACDDVGALNYLADPKTPRVRLRRSIRFLQNQADAGQGPDFGTGWVGPCSATAMPGRPRLSDSPLKLAQRKRTGQGQPSGRQPKRGPSSASVVPFLGMAGEEEDAGGTLQSSHDGHLEEVGDGAIWCTPAHAEQQPRLRRLYGEIHLPRGLQPTCKFPLFNLLYRVELLAPRTNAFIPDGLDIPSPNKGKARATDSGEGVTTDSHVYASHFVEIVTDARKDEPHPISFVWANTS